jgi:hypothetical protein
MGVTNEQLQQQAASLKGATMPDGQKYEDWLKSKGYAGWGKQRPFLTAVRTDFAESPITGSSVADLPNDEKVAACAIRDALR